MISLVEVHERVAGDLSFRSVKKPKRANRCISWLRKKSRKRSVFVVYSHF